jgi:hypothetical protein
MNLHPTYGYDLERVPKVNCLYCHNQIGDEEYVEVKPLARFGQMLFVHKRCDEKVKWMDIFKTDLRVEGQAIGGMIRDGKFHMNLLNPSNTPAPPSARIISFDKKWLDVTIEELKAVRDKL